MCMHRIRQLCKVFLCLIVPAHAASFSHFHQLSLCPALHTNTCHIRGELIETATGLNIITHIRVALQKKQMYVTEPG